MIGAFGGASAGGVRMGPGVSVAGPSSWEFSNLPSGWTTIREHDGSVVLPDGNWQVVDQQTTTVPSHQVVSVTTPVGSTAVRQHWEGTTNGLSPDFLAVGLGGSTNRLYFGQIMRLSPTWVWPTTGFGCKWTTILAASGGAGWTYAGSYYQNGTPNQTTTFWHWNDQAGRTSANWMTEPDPTSTGNYQDGDSGWQHIVPSPIPNGEWFKKEVLLQYDIGQVQVWINGVKVADALEQYGQPWVFPEGYAAVELQAGSTLGGGYSGPMLSSDYYADYASILIAHPPS